MTGTASRLTALVFGLRGEEDFQFGDIVAKVKGAADKSRSQQLPQHCSRAGIGVHQNKGSVFHVKLLSHRFYENRFISNLKEPFDSCVQARLMQLILGS